MADEKLNTGPAENTSPEAAGPITTPEQAAASEPRQEQTGPAISLPAFEGAHDPLAGAESWLYGVEQGRDGCRPAGTEAVSCCMEGYQ